MRDRKDPGWADGGEQTVAHSCWEQQKIQGRAAKNPGKSGQNTAKSNCGTGKAESGVRAAKGAGDKLSSHCLKNHLVGFSDFSALDLLENRQKLSARKCCALNFGLKIDLRINLVQLSCVDLEQIHVWGRKNSVVVIKFNIFWGQRHKKSRQSMKFNNHCYSSNRTIIKSAVQEFVGVVIRQKG